MKEQIIGVCSLLKMTPQTVYHFHRLALIIRWAAASDTAGYQCKLNLCDISDGVKDTALHQPMVSLQKKKLFLLLCTKLPILLRKIKRKRTIGSTFFKSEARQWECHYMGLN